MARIFRIHPGIGVARVGNSDKSIVLTSEHASVPVNWNETTQAFDSFRDDRGAIKRQAARFRVFEYRRDEAGAVTATEVRKGGDVVDVEWRVHLANRKASFFSFSGNKGEADLFRARTALPADHLIEQAPPLTNRRNATVPDDRRHELEIDPGEQMISWTSPTPVVLKNRNQAIPVIPDLGELRVDDEGRLLVVPGRGSARAIPEDAPLRQYANNDGWFDDVGDGSIKARIKLADGSVVDADAAWVVVGPPDFAPSVNNAVTLYDLLWDLGVRKLPELAADSLFARQELPHFAAQRAAWFGSGEKSLEGYEPSFVQEIYPIFKRALEVTNLHLPKPVERHFHGDIDYGLFSRKSAGDPLGVDPAEFRDEIFTQWIRDPSVKAIDWERMPRGLGDAYDTLTEPRPAPNALLSFTPIQFALLKQWQLGNFRDDWPGQEPGVPARGPVTPAGLDRAALEGCVGGPFFPGIEVSWLIREASLYVEPFRLRVPTTPASEAGQAETLSEGLRFTAGFFSQQMAQPWQADFYDCHKEEPDNQHGSTPHFYMWWTAQRPDDVFPVTGDEQQPWARHLVPPEMSIDELEEDDQGRRFQQMVALWHEQPFVLPAADGRLREER